MSTPRRDFERPESVQRALQRDFEKWESELPATRSRLVPNWFRRRVSGPVVKWCHVVGHAALGPNRFL